MLNKSSLEIDFKDFQHLKIISILSFSLLLSLLILMDVPLKYLAGAFILIIFVLTLFYKPLYFLYIIFFLRPTFDNLLLSIRFSLYGIDIGLWGVLALLLVTGTILYILVKKISLGRINQKIVMLYALFCLFSFFSFFMSLVKTDSAKVLLRYFSVFAIILLTIINIRNQKTAILLVKAMIFSALMPLLLGFKQLYSQGGRLTATFAHPNILAFYLLVIIGCLFFQLYKPGNITKVSLFNNIYCFILITALVFTKTRSSWAAFILMGLIYSLVFRRKLFLPLIVLIIIFGSLPFVQQHLLNLGDVSYGSIYVNKMSSLGWRLDNWRYLMKAAIRKPILGYGINATSYLGEEAHNDYLRFFTEGGVVGLAAYFGPYLFVFFHSLRNYKYHQNDLLKKFSGFFICFIPAFFLMSVTENLGRYITVHWYIWALIGIYFSLYSTQEGVKLK